MKVSEVASLCCAQALYRCEAFFVEDHLPEVTPVTSVSAWIPAFFSLLFDFMTLIATNVTNHELLKRSRRDKDEESGDIKIKRTGSYVLQRDVNQATLTQVQGVAGARNMVSLQLFLLPAAGLYRDRQTHEITRFQLHPGSSQFS